MFYTFGQGCILVRFKSCFFIALFPWGRLQASLRFVFYDLGIFFLVGYTTKKKSGDYERGKRSRGRGGTCSCLTKQQAGKQTTHSGVSVRRLDSSSVIAVPAPKTRARGPPESEQVPRRDGEERLQRQKAEEKKTTTRKPKSYKIKRATNAGTRG